MVRASSNEDCGTGAIPQESLRLSVRVLIADDSVIVCDEPRHHLNAWDANLSPRPGIRCRHWHCFRTVSPPFVILDISVPQTGGIGALALLRITRSEDPTVLVLTTGPLALPEMRKSLSRESAVDYLIKRSDLNGFEEIRRLLEESLDQLSGQELAIVTDALMKSLKLTPDGIKAIPPGLDIPFTIGVTNPVVRLV